MEFITKSPEETKSLGRKIAADITGGEIFALSGNLGSGKTTFVQGFALGLGITGRIISPTFILMRTYSLKDKKFFHVDLYRLDKKVDREVTNLGLKDIWGKPNSIVIIEWAEKIRGVVPKGAQWIKFETLEGDKRKIIIQ